MSDKKNTITTGLLISKEERLFGLVDYAIFQKDDDTLRCVSQWSEAREMLVQYHFDLVMVDESAVMGESFEGFSSFIRMLAAENTVCAIFIRSVSPDIEQMRQVLSDSLVFVDMNRGKLQFVETLGELKRRADEARDAEEQKRQTVSLDETTGRLELELPPITKGGDLGDVSFSRFLYSLRYRRYFGMLRLVHSSGVSTELEFVKGRIVRCSKEALKVLFTFFEQPEGQFFLAESPDVSAQITDNALEPIDLIWEGVSTRTPESSLRQELVPYLNKKLIPSNFYKERRVRYSGIGSLAALVDACQKHATLEEAMKDLSYPHDELCAAAFFLIRTDMLVPRENKNHRVIQVVYARDVRQQRQRVTDRAKRDTKAFQMSSHDLKRLQIVDELRERARRFQSASAYEILGVWEGCGKKVVNEQFYRAVREHHPDTYGGNITAETKKLADQVFVLIQKARSELLRREGEQTRPDPGDLHTPSKVTGDAPISSPQLDSSPYNSPLRTGFGDLSSDSYIEMNTELASEITDPEVRKRRIRELHEKRRRMSSVNNAPISTQPLSAVRARLASGEVPSLGRQRSVAQMTPGPPPHAGGPPVGLGRQPSGAEMRTDRLERLSNAHQSIGILSQGKSDAEYSQNANRLERLSNRPAGASFVSSTGGMLNEGVAEFEQGNWEKAMHLLMLAQHTAEQKRVDALISYARYKLHPETQETAITELKACVETSDGCFDGNRLLAKIYIDKEEWKLAFTRLEAALSIKADDASLAKDLAFVKEQLAKEEPRQQRPSSFLGKWFSKKS